MRAFLPSLLLLAVAPLFAASQPMVGAKAPDFTLQTPDHQPVELSQVLGHGPVVLVVLRGYPGYQCPYCNRQVQDLIQKAPDFAQRDARIIAVYPGPPDDLASKANQFLSDKNLPGNFTLVLDPGYQFTNAYGLRWDADKETAYPATFLIDNGGQIFFSKIVKSHGARAGSAELLEALPKPKQ